MVVESVSSNINGTRTVITSYEKLGADPSLVRIEHRP